MINHRKVVAALACRNNSKRLYGKPLQNIHENISIIDYIINNLKKYPQYINTICLGISKGLENEIFIEKAKQHQIPYILGDEKDVLHSLIMCGESQQATDIFRITTECPFIALEYLDNIYQNHTQNNNDVTVLDGVPHGMHFEIYTLNALKKSHQDGTDIEKSEYCSLHIRNNLDKFKVQVITPELDLMRGDIRVTVDYPEDLILCRELYYAYETRNIDSLNLKNIVSYINANEKMQEINKKYCTNKFFWL